MSIEEIAAKLATRPLRERRALLRVYWHYQRLRNRLPDYGLTPRFRDVLRMGHAASRRLNQDAVFHDWLVSLEWLALLNRSKSDLQKDASHIQFADHSPLATIAADSRPVILAPMHMGCFALVFGRIMNDYFAGRPMLILRAREDRPIETEAMKRVSEVGSEMRFLNVRDKQSYFDAVRFARSGAVIVMFVDLPGSYGGAIDTQLFQQHCQLAMGIDSLARLTEASVVPLFVTSSHRGDEVHFGKPFESLSSGKDEKARVTQLVRRHIEEALSLAPAQWYMWTRLDEFLKAPPDIEEAA